MNAIASLAARPTLPYRRGAETLALAFGAPAGDFVPIAGYDFSDYRARWGEDPAAPAYLVAPLFDVVDDDVALTIACAPAGTPDLTLTIPKGTLAGTSLCIALPQAADASLRLRSISASPPLPVAADQAWCVLALLGNVAKLAAVLGVEKQSLQRVRHDTCAQRRVEDAFGAGLDAIGADLSVPRFPPRPHSFDPDTVALWHLDETVADGGQVVDESTRPGVAGHPGIVAKATSTNSAKYGNGYAFDGVAGVIVVAASPDFDVAADADASFEAFVAAAAPQDASPHAIVARRAAENAAGLLAPGWSLCIANERGFSANPLFAVCDGAVEVRCHADLSIADGAFHHIAGVIDRRRRRARLFVDGIQRATAAIDGLGAIAPPDDVRFGATTTGNQLRATIDEVRISRIARTTFHPVLGEDDDAYRARLRLFRRWEMPTPQRMLALINEAAPLDGDPASYILVEANRTTNTAECALRIVPAALAAGLAIAADGQPARDETVAGTPTDDAGFDAALDLVAYADAAVDATADPGNARMQAGAAAMLDALAAQLATDAVGGRLVLTHSFDASGPTPLHTVGRALRLRHSTLALADLGARAHRAGFAYVRNLGTEIAVAVPAGERLAVRATPAAGSRVDVGTAFDLVIAAPQPSAATFSWTIVSPGTGHAGLAAHSADPPLLKTPLASRSRVRIVTDAPGDIVVRAEVSYRGRTRSGSLSLRVDPVTLPDGQAMDAACTPVDDAAAVVAPPDRGFDPAYLATHAATPAIDFGADPANARMQVAALDALDGLAALLAARGVPGRLRVTAAFAAGAAGVAAVGRLLQLQHETLDPGALGALAQRFFDAVARTGTTISAYLRADAWLSIRRAADGLPAGGDLALGTPLDLALLPGALPVGSFNWSVRDTGVGMGSFSSLLQPATRFTPTQAGRLVLVLIQVADDPARAAPYTFEVALKPALDVPATLIPKPQYDIVMNVLDAFHPIGVEVRTDRLRAHVREVEQDPTKAFPAYSFPGFRF